MAWVRSAFKISRDELCYGWPRSTFIYRSSASSAPCMVNSQLSLTALFGAASVALCDQIDCENLVEPLVVGYTIESLLFLSAKGYRDEI